MKYPIRKKIFRVVFVPLAFSIITSVIILFSAFESQRTMVQTKRYVEYASKIGALIHELQKERGRSSGFLGSKGTKFSAELAEQRKLSDTQLSSYNAVSAIMQENVPPEFRERIQQSSERVKALAARRTAVNDMAISAPEAVKFYSDVISSLIEQIRQVTIYNVSDDQLQSTLQSYFYLIQIKERLGMTRAHTSNILAKNLATRQEVQRLTTLRAEYKAFMTMFQETSQPEFLQQLQKINAEQYLTKTEEIISKILSSPDETALGESPDEWFAAITKHIDGVAKIENSCANQAIMRAEDIAFQMKVRFTILLCIIILVLWIAYRVGTKVQRSITEPLGELVAYTKSIASGTFSSIKIIDSQDETAELAKAFQDMVLNVQKAQESLHEQNISIQQRVDEAVSEAVVQRQYLEQSVNTMLSAMNQFAEGNLEVQLHVEKNDTIGKLFEGFNKVVDNMRKLLVQITELSERATSAIDAITQSCNQLAAGSAEMSAQSTEIASGIEEMAKTVSENASYSSKSAHAALRNGEVARSGETAVQNMILKIQQIARVVQQSTETVHHLGTSSEAIGAITLVINEIADQTNLLALNAAIEAARAGEQGRGFAVVADEVRKLAERTTKATKEIATTVQSIQKETIQAVEVISEGSREVDEGLALATNAGEALHSILTSTEDVETMIQHIAAATEEQSSTAEQIAKNIESIVSVIDISARDTDGIAKTVNDINELMHKLTQAVAIFHNGSTQSKGLPAQKLSLQE